MSKEHILLPTILNVEATGTVGMNTYRNISLISKITNLIRSINKVYFIKICVIVKSHVNKTK